MNLVKTLSILTTFLLMSFVHIFAQNPTGSETLSKLRLIGEQLDGEQQRELLAYAEYLLLKSKETPAQRDARHQAADDQMPTSETADKVADYFRYAVSKQETPLQRLERDNAPTAAIRFEHTEHQFGEARRGSVIEHVYPFTNISQQQLILYDVDAACGCTIAEWPREPIPPGGGGKIRVVFDTAFKQGEQAKVITVLSNTAPRHTPLLIKGKVLP